MMNVLEIFVFVIIVVLWVGFWGCTIADSDNAMGTIAAAVMMFAVPIAAICVVYEANQQESPEQQVCEEVEGQVWVNDKCYVEKEAE